MKKKKENKISAKISEKSSLAPLFLVVFLDVLGFGIIIPVLRDYTELLALASGYGKDNLAFLAGILMTSYSFAQFVFAPILGWLSDRYGRRLVLIISVAGNVLSYFLWMVSSSYGLFLISRIISGITGGNISVAQSYVADVTSKESRAKTMAVLGAFFGIGFTIGPFFGGLLYSFDMTNYNLYVINFNQFSSIGLVVMLLSLINLFWIFFRVKETNAYIIKSDKTENLVAENTNANKLDEHFTRKNPSSDAIKDTAKDAEKTQRETLSSAVKTKKRVGFFSIWKELKRPLLGRLFLINFIETVAFVSFESIMAWDLKDRFHHDTRMTGYFFAYIGILLSIVQGGLYRFLIKKTTERKLLPAGFLALGLSLFALPFLDSYTLVLLDMIPMMIGVGIINPSINALASLYSPENEQGVHLGLLQGFGAVARTFTPVLMTLIYDEISTSLPFWFAGLLALSLLWFLRPLPEARGYQIKNNL